MLWVNRWQWRFAGKQYSEVGELMFGYHNPNSRLGKEQVANGVAEQ
jgi:hypothetical protein